MDQAKLEKQKGALLRLLSAHADMGYATDAFNRFQASRDEQERYHFFLSMVICYCRPFTENRGIGSLPPRYAKYEDANMTKRHKRLIRLRHDFMAHTGPFSTFAVLSGPAEGITSVARRGFLHPQYAPWLHDVVSALTKRLHSDARGLVGSLHRAGVEWPLRLGVQPEQNVVIWDDEDPK